MGSWKLCLLLLLCVLIALVAEAESKKKPGGSNRKPGRGNDKDDEENDRMLSSGGRRRKPNGGRKSEDGSKIFKGRKNKEDRKRVPSPAKMVKLMTKLSSPLDEFGLKTYKKMSEIHPDNFVYSPFSLHTALSMLLLGTAGKTKNELTNGLGIKGAIHPAQKAYNDSLENIKDNGTDLAMANNLYYRAGVTIVPKFIQKLQRFYGSSVEQFKETNPEAAINDWVKNKTRGEITDFLSPGDVTPDMVFMLLNAVYFKGLWKFPFNKNSTRLRPFYTTPTEVVQVDTMTVEAELKTASSNDLNADVIELPYQGDRFSFYVVLPKTNLTEVEQRLTTRTLAAGLKEVDMTAGYKMNVFLPKFGLDTEQSFREILQKIGITQIFNPQQASLKKMTKAKNVYVSEVNHRAVIEVDEEGTVAAAVTSIGIRVLSLPPQVNLNRPFLFLLRDKLHGINLFIGRFTNPKGRNLKN